MYKINPSAYYLPLYYNRSLNNTRVLLLEKESNGNSHKLLNTGNLYKITSQYYSKQLKNKNKEFLIECHHLLAQEQHINVEVIIKKL